MIGLIYHEDNWIIQRVGDALCTFPGFTRDLRDAKVRVYLPYYLQPEDKSPRCELTVSLFTHREKAPGSEAKQAKFDEAAETADLCWAMSRKTAADLPADKTFVLPIPADGQFGRTFIDIGIVGHDQPFDRKGVDATLTLLSTIPGVRLLYTNGRLPWDQVPGFYSKLDYVLVTGNVEGGPMCVPEAIAMGKPVIAPDVGWAWDWPVIRYGSRMELYNIVEKLAPSTNRWGEFASRLKRELGE